MEKLFQIRARGTSISQEILCGVTTFLTMSYILFVNPVIVAESGMPLAGAFASTVLAAAVCSFIMGFFANVPFGMAPGMGLNTFFTYTACATAGFHWQEALALVFVSGILHILIMATGARKALVNAIPHHLKMAFGVGLGLFIGYIGLKNAGLLMFTTPSGKYQFLANGGILSGSEVVPGFTQLFGGPQIVALAGLGVMLILFALEKKTGEPYVALPIGILAATFVGIPLGITHLSGVTFFDSSAFTAFRSVSFAFWGDPGLLSIVSDPQKVLTACLLVLIFLTTNVVDSVGTIIGIGQVQDATIFTDGDMESFADKKSCGKLDKALVCNSFGGSVSALLGGTTVTVFMESITGIVAGGRTGLVAVTVGVMFLLCLPLANFFSLIPAEAIAPALIVAGGFMIPLVARIQWSNFEEAFPAFATILCIPLTYGFVYGIAAGVLAHVVIQVGLGKGRDVHPALYAMAVVFIAVVGAEAKV